MKWNLSKNYYLLAGIVSALLAVYALGHVTCLIMLPDEFGYWANAAAMLGWDWSEISSLHSYYSFGYSFLLLPILKFINNPVMVYRISILLNFILVFGHACILYKLITSFFPRADERSRVCISAAGACYSGFVAYANLSMTEVLLSFLFLCLVWMLQEYLQRGGWIRAVLTAFLSVYLFTVHMRMAAVAAAACITVFLAFWQDREKRKYLPAVLAGIALAGCMVLGIKGYLNGSLYALTPEVMLEWNSMGGQWKKLAGLFTPEGIRNFICGVTGKLFYLGNATFFTFYWGMFFLGKKAYRSIKAVKQAEKGDWIYLFLLLSVTGTFLVTAIYLGGGGRIDGIVYGRYNEAVIPIIICLGLVEMLRSPHVFKAAFCILIFQSLCIWVIDFAVQTQELTAFQGYMSIGMAFAIDQSKALISSITRGPFVVCGMLAFLLSVGIALIRRKKGNSIYALLLLAGLFLLIGWRGAVTYFYPHAKDNFREIELAGELQAELAKRPGGELYYVHQGNTEYVDNLQFALREQRIHVISEDEVLKQSMSAGNWGQAKAGIADAWNFVIVYEEFEQKGKLALRYPTVLRNGRFEVYFQEIEEIN